MTNFENVKRNVCKFNLRVGLGKYYDLVTSIVAMVATSEKSAIVN